MTGRATARPSDAIALFSPLAGRFLGTALFSCHARGCWSGAQGLQGCGSVLPGLGDQRGVRAASELFSELRSDADSL